MDPLLHKSVNNSTRNNSVDRQLFADGGVYNFLDSRELKVLIPAILGTVCVLGFAGNITAMGVLVNNAVKGKLTLVNALILNLTLADSLVLAFAVPFKTAAFTRASWTLGWFVCKTCDWLLHSCMVAKSFTVAIMAKSCYRYVRNPNKQVSIRQKAILTILLLVWVLACLVSVPHGLFASVERQGEELECVQLVPPSARNAMAVYVKAYPLMAFCAPLSFALLYFWRAYGRCQRRGSKTQNLRTQIRSRQLTVMLFSLTVATATMWLPQWVVWVWSQHAAENGGRPPPPLFILCGQLLMFSLSLVDPLIILALSEEFRDGYAELWRRFTLRKHPPKNRPGPHAPTAPKSPCPRPETAGHPPPGRADGTDKPKPADAPEPSAVKPNSPTNKDSAVLPDLEQFWHERQTGPPADQNDPVPWEHQDQAEVKPQHG